MKLISCGVSIHEISVVDSNVKKAIHTLIDKC